MGVTSTRGIALPTGSPVSKGGASTTRSPTCVASKGVSNDTHHDLPLHAPRVADTAHPRPSALVYVMRMKDTQCHTCGRWTHTLTRYGTGVVYCSRVCKQGIKPLRDTICPRCHLWTHQLTPGGEGPVNCCLGATS